MIAVGAMAGEAQRAFHLVGEVLVAGEALGSPLAQAGGIDQVHQAPVLRGPGGRVQLDSREGLQLALKARQHLCVRLPLHRVPARGRRPELHSWGAGGQTASVARLRQGMRTRWLTAG